MRLYVCVVAAEKLLTALTCDVFDDVNALTASVIALCRVSLGIFVGEYTSCSGKHCLGHDVFACDKFNIVLLTLCLLLYGFVYLTVDGFQYVDTFSVGHCGSPLLFTGVLL